MSHPYTPIRSKYALCSCPAWRGALAAPQPAIGEKLCGVPSAGGHGVILLGAVGLLPSSLEIKVSVVPAPRNSESGKTRNSRADEWVFVQEREDDRRDSPSPHWSLGPVAVTHVGLQHKSSCLSQAGKQNRAGRGKLARTNGSRRSGRSSLLRF